MSYTTVLNLLIGTVTSDSHKAFFKHIMFYWEVVRKSGHFAKLLKVIITGYCILKTLFRNTNRIKSFLLYSQLSSFFCFIFFFNIALHQAHSYSFIFWSSLTSSSFCYAYELLVVIKVHFLPKASQCTSQNWFALVKLLDVVSILETYIAYVSCFILCHFHIRLSF